MNKSKRLEALESRLPKSGENETARQQLLDAIETVIGRQVGFEAPNGWFEKASPIEVAAYSLREDAAMPGACIERMAALADQETPTGTLFKAIIAGMETAAKNNPHIQARS